MAMKSFRNVVLHVGLHKTGTNYFQKRIWSQLKTYSILTRPFTVQNHAFSMLQYADDSMYDKELVINELGKIEAENLLISDPLLTGKSITFSYINRSIIAKRLKELFPEAKIILFIPLPNGS